MGEFYDKFCACFFIGNLLAQQILFKVYLFVLLSVFFMLCTLCLFVWLTTCSGCLVNINLFMRLRCAKKRLFFHCITARKTWALLTANCGVLLRKLSGSRTIWLLTRITTTIYLTKSKFFFDHVPHSAVETILGYGLTTLYGLPQRRTEVKVKLARHLMHHGVFH